MTMTKDQEQGAVIEHYLAMVSRRDALIAEYEATMLQQAQEIGRLREANDALQWRVEEKERMAQTEADAAARARELLRAAHDELAALRTRNAELSAKVAKYEAATGLTFGYTQPEPGDVAPPSPPKVDDDLPF